MKQTREQQLLFAKEKIAKNSPFIGYSVFHCLFYELQTTGWLFARQMLVNQN